MYRLPAVRSVLVFLFPNRLTSGLLEFFEAKLDVDLEAINVSESVFNDVEVLVVNQGTEVHGPVDTGFIVCGMGIEEGGVGEAATHHSEIVALASLDLGVEHAIEGGLELRAGAGGVEGFVFVDKPIESAPDLAAPGLFGALVGGEHAKRFDAAERDGDVRVVLVCRIVKVDDFGSGLGKDCEQIVHAGFVG